MEMEQDLPGFRFHPTEEELLDFYLHRVVHGMKLNFDIIGTINIYRYDPWDLPGTCSIPAHPTNNATRKKRQRARCCSSKQQMIDVS
jgi:hypothetical protein